MPRKYIRKTGETARALSIRDRRRLSKFRARQAGRLGLPSLSVDALKTMMGAPFDRKTLLRVIEGKPVRGNNCRLIEEFLDRHMPESVRPAEVKPDGKSLSAGERNEENESGVQKFMRIGRDAQQAVDEAITRGSR
jgi:hypothetical protein